MTWTLWIIVTFLLETGGMVTVRAPIATFASEQVCEAQRNYVKVEMAKAYPDPTTEEPLPTYLCVYTPSRRGV